MADDQKDQKPEEKPNSDGSDNQQANPGEATGDVAVPPAVPTEGEQHVREDEPTAEARLAALEYATYKDKAIEAAAKKYPDVPRDMLEVAENEQQIDEIATKFIEQKKVLQQEALSKAQTAGDVPKLSDADASAQLDSLKDSGQLEKALSIKLQQVGGI